MDKNSIRVKRPVKIKTIVTHKFKEQAQNDLGKEITMLEVQIMQLELQSKQIQDQVSSLSSTYENQNFDQIQQSLNEVSKRLEQMSELKQELQSQKESITHLLLDNIIVTGSLENYVELKTGENIYEKFKEAEIIVKDGVIQDIIE